MKEQYSGSINPDAPESEISSEHPIKGLVEDRLGRKEFAQAVANVISKWTGRDSLVVAIYGPWGSGKTSTKNMVLDSLAKAHAKTLSMEFNPWEWVGQEKVFEGFFGELSAKLGAVDTSKRSARTAKKMQMYGAMLSAAGSITSRLRPVLVGLLVAIGLFGLAPLINRPYVTDVVSILAAVALLMSIVLAASGETATKIADYLEAKADAMRQSLGDAKEELRVLLQALPRNVLIIVDDIDRLTPDEIRVVFQLVKANADFPNLIYMLLFQRDTIEKALGRMGEVDGSQFLEKIVQVGFDLPKLSAQTLDESLEFAINASLKKTSGDRKFDSQRWGKLFVASIRPYFRTLRDVKRFSRSLSFHLELYAKNGTFDANSVDLIALEVLRQFEAPLYHRLYGAKELLTGGHRSLLGPWRISEQQKAAEGSFSRCESPGRSERYS